MIADGTTVNWTSATYMVVDDTAYSTFSNCDSTSWREIAKMLEAEPEPPPAPPFLAHKQPAPVKPRPVAVKPCVSRPIQQCCWRSGRWKSLT
jgi:hypothetical protein